MIDGYRVEARTPGVDDYIRLRTIAGLTPFPREASEIGLRGTIFGVVAMQGGRAVGMGRIVGDGGCFFQVTDIAVDPDHQGRGLGRAVMTALTDHIDHALPRGAYVSLMADVPADRLYAQFGFASVAPRSLGMFRWVG